MTEPGEASVAIKVSIKMSDYDLHMKKMIEKVLKPAGLIFRYIMCTRLHKTSITLVSVNLVPVIPLFPHIWLYSITSQKLSYVRRFN